jgi:hypothetical protein
MYIKGHIQGKFVYSCMFSPFLVQISMTVILLINLYRIIDFVENEHYVVDSHLCKVVHIIGINPYLEKVQNYNQMVSYLSTKILSQPS